MNHHTIVKEPVDADHSALSAKNEMNYKALKFKVGDRAMIINYKNIFSKGYTENSSKEIFAKKKILGYIKSKI